MDRSVQGVYNNFNCYEKNGIDGLQLGHSTGRKKKMTEVQEEALYKTDSFVMADFASVGRISIQPWRGAQYLALQRFTRHRLHITACIKIKPPMIL